MSNWKLTKLHIKALIKQKKCRDVNMELRRTAELLDDEGSQNERSF